MRVSCAHRERVQEMNPKTMREREKMELTGQIFGKN